MADDVEPSPTEFTKAALAAYRRRWRERLGSIGRIFSPQSPLGPGVGGMLSVILTVIVALIIGPIVTRAAIWWWSLWLSWPSVR